MSGNWDDSDSENDNVEIGNPVIIPRARQPSIAKSLEKANVQILENPLEGSEHNGEDSEDDSLSIASDAESEEFADSSGEVITLDFDVTCNMKKMIAQFDCTQRNIISEFADVEIFLISLDSLIIECLEHCYHDFTLAGQTIVLTTQLDRFLCQFSTLGGRFKLVIFSDMWAQFSRDTTLSFARACAIAHIQSGKYAKDVEVFHSPADPRWNSFLREITPSFMMISTDNVSRAVCAQDEVDLSPHLETITLHCLSMSVPIVPLFSIAVNFSEVTAFFIEPKLVIMVNWESFCAAHWDMNSELYRSATCPSLDASSYATVSDLWAKIIAEAKATPAKELSEHFDSLASAILISSLVCARRGPRRVYLPERKDGRRGLDIIRDRRLLLVTATTFLEKVNFKTSKFSLSDFWDGRMILGIFDEIVAGNAVLPYRVQSEFAALHQAATLTKPIATDTNDRLFDAISDPVDPLADLPLLYEVESALIKQYVPELKTAKSEKVIKDGSKQDFADFFQQKLSWKLKILEEEYAKPPEKIENQWQLKKANKMKQLLSRWYEMFANSLEGRGSNLLVDFSRTPKGFAVAQDENEDKNKGKKAWSGQKVKPKVGAKEVKSKKEMILEANKNAKSQKLIEGEKNKIKFAMQQGKNAIQYLYNLYPTLELDESLALCEYETTVRVAKELFSRLTGKEFVEQRRLESVKLVGLLKNCLTKHWQYLEDKQKETITDIWVSMGFEAPKGTKPSADALAKKADMGFNMVYYQMEFAGELIDIQSDPQKDDRVTGFAPDAWQRRMLDAVDLGHSALIIAPTSAGKTFVSYYCIEKVLRQSDEDVVVYVSPSKALTNQVCGSIYARFRNKQVGRGKSLFGTLTNDYGTNTLNCQVLVTIPESLERLLLSTNPLIQQFAAKIKYVIFDEVHSIGASEEAPIWEHLLLFIRCPFIALSATIGNAEKLHSWLSACEKYKSAGKRKVELIHYGERYSELELGIQIIDKPQPIDADDADEASKVAKPVEKKETCIQQFMPYGVFMPEKIRMFGIPEDQQLTSRQILQLYRAMADLDEKTKKEFEPCNFFGYRPGQLVWLDRATLRNMERGLKKRFLEWLEKDEDKMRKVLVKLSGPIDTQLEHRSIPFNQMNVAVHNIVPLIDELRDRNMLPAICFNDDRFVCEKLARTLCEELENRQMDFENSAEFKAKYAIKDEEKIMKLAKRKRDKDAKKKEGGEKEENEDADASDPLALQKTRMKAALAVFKLRGKAANLDEDVYEKVIDKLTRAGKAKDSTKFFLRLFERGIGFHHSGMTVIERGAVEILFRSGHLAVIFSTSTLALGMNMPCKTVIFGVDTPDLTPLLFRQMSGRAGRRGFDHSGTVLFMSVPTSKIRRLLTASLSTLHGNPPFSTSFLLRLLVFVHQQNVPNLDDKNAGPISTVEQRAEAALALLMNSFSLFTRREAETGSLQKQLRLFVAFSVQLLRHLELLDKNCAAKGLWQLAACLRGGEPGNLLFVHLLQNGVLHRYCKKYKGEELKRKILMLMAILFTRVRLPPSFRPEDRSSFPSATNCSIFLEQFPSDVRSHVDSYNKTVLSLYTHYMSAATQNKTLMDDVFSLTGKDPEEVSRSSVFGQNLVNSFPDGFSYDLSFLPTFNPEEKDHRGRRVYYNAFAVDFWVHESRKKLESVNKLYTSQMWFQVSAFLNILIGISEGLQVVARPQDPVAEVMKQLAYEYDHKFRAAFGMKMKS